jgi:hypothetical protein
MSQLRAQVDADFAIELARNAALRALVEMHGRDAVEMSWKLGWFSGYGIGLDKAKEIMA